MTLQHNTGRIADEVADVEKALADGGQSAAEVFKKIRRVHPEDVQAVADALAGIGGAR
jgi:hypothetical protein